MQWIDDGIPVPWPPVRGTPHVPFPSEAPTVKQPVCAPFLLAVVGLAGLWAASPPFTRVGVAADSVGLPRDLQWQGVGSCAAAGCHHGNGPLGSKGSEYTTWITADPHARAFAVLYSAASKTIEKNLRQLRDVKEARPEEDRLCLRCHAVDPDRVRRSEGLSLQDGVGCESCHGPAEKWLAQHYRAGWKELTPPQKLALGMRPLGDLATRVQVCTECHVGTGDQEVNHDLIAAGHPRLNFEFAAYQALLPRHWTEKGINARPDFEARSWSVGQLLAARAALDLLAARAERAARPEDPAPWPEFAEYDCFACHHDLRDERWRRERDVTRRGPGTYPWGTWYTFLTPRLAGPWGGSDGKQTLATLADLEQRMGQAYPDPAKVAQLARQAGVPLEQWARRPDAEVAPDVVRRLLAAVTKPEEPPAWSWDTAAQTYLAAVALQQARHAQAPQSADAQVVAKLRALRQTLEYPPGYNSPHPFRPEQFQNRLGDLQTLLHE